MDRKSLREVAELFNDSQSFRIAIDNKLRSGTRRDDPLIAQYTDMMGELEKLSQKMLVGTYKRMVPEPVREWQKETPGIGEHLLARLIGVIGHPRVAEPYHWETPKSRKKSDEDGPKRVLVADEPFDRTVGQLWQYCGHGAPGRRVRGMSQDEALWLGNPSAKMLTHVIAEGATKESGRAIAELLEKEGPKRRRKPYVSDASWPYRRVYEQRRVETFARTHNAECVRCGPSGKPAQEGTPWNPGHAHADALRIVGKEVLRDLWLAAA